MAGYKFLVTSKAWRVLNQASYGDWLPEYSNDQRLTILLAFIDSDAARIGQFTDFVEGWTAAEFPVRTERMEWEGEEDDDVE